MDKNTLPKKILSVSNDNSHVLGYGILYQAGSTFSPPDGAHVVQVPFNYDNVTGMIFSGTVDADGWCESPTFTDPPKP